MVEKVPGIHLLRPSSYTQVTLTDCLQPRTNRRGRGRVTRALFTVHNWGSPSLSVFTTCKNTAYRRNGITGNFSGFENLTFQNCGIPWNRLSFHAYLADILFLIHWNCIEYSSFTGNSEKKKKGLYNKQTCLVLDNPMKYVINERVLISFDLFGT